jgi:hypothetical protein
MSSAQNHCYNSNAPYGKLTQLTNTTAVVLVDSTTDTFATKTFTDTGIYLFQANYSVGCSVADATGVFFRFTCSASNFTGDNFYYYALEDQTIAVGTGTSVAYTGFIPITQSGTTITFSNSPLFGGGTLTRGTANIYFVKIA